MKVFALNDCEWWAAETLQEAMDHYLEWTGLGEADEPFDEPYELDDEDLDNLEFYDEDCNCRSFREQLDYMIAEGQEFPCLFATTEY